MLNAVEKAKPVEEGIKWSEKVARHVKQKHSKETWDDTFRRQQEETGITSLHKGKDRDKCFVNTGWKIRSADLKARYQLII